MKRPAVIDLVLFALLLVAGAGLRLALQDLPNFAPVAAIAMFAGYFFRSWLLAACLPLAILASSDYFIGGYDWRMMFLVHGALVMPVLARGILRRLSPLTVPGATSRVHAGGMFCAGVIGSSLAASCVFFLLTNFGAWLWFDMYEPSLAGLARCYVSALPFFRYTLAGDFCFAVVLFGGYAVAVGLGWIADRSVGRTTRESYL